MSDETRAYQGSDADTPTKQTMGWMISEVYAMTRKISRHLGVDGEPRQRTVAEMSEQVAALDAVGLVSLREQVANLEAKLVETTHLPNLGLASNEAMLRELISRFGNWQASQYYTNLDRVVILAEMLGGLSATEREYRTVDGD